MTVDQVKTVASVEGCTYRRFDVDEIHLERHGKRLTMRGKSREGMTTMSLTEAVRSNLTKGDRNGL
jgi:hypothetical protein